MLFKNDEKWTETWRSGGKKRSSLQNKWFGCEVAHAVKEKTRYKPLMVHTQCPGTADRLFNNHRLSVSLFLIFSAHLPTVSQSASLSLSLHHSQLSSKFANLVWISHFSSTSLHKPVLCFTKRSFKPFPSHKRTSVSISGVNTWKGVWCNWIRHRYFRQQQNDNVIWRPVRSGCCFALGRDTALKKWMKKGSAQARMRG